MSGDNSAKKYDEPTAMKKQAIELGVSEEDIVLDYVENVNGQMVLPIKRYNCMLRFYK